MGSQKKTIYYQLLAIRCQRREKEAMEELIQTFEKRLFYYIKRLVDNEEDTWNILQDTWLKVISSIQKLKNPKSLPVWLYSIARTSSMSYLRKRYSNQALFEYKKDISNIEDNNENITFDDAEQVHYGLSKISLAHREILTLFFLQDLSTEQIANVLDISVGTVKSRLFYAKKALKEILAKEVNTNE